MGMMFSQCARPTEVKVIPGQGEASPVADVLNTTFFPPITPCKENNPWLPLLTPSQLVEIHTNFKKFDRDGDGHIEPKEIRTVMRNVGMSIDDDKVNKMLQEVDTDGNGMIEFDEFLSIMASNMLRTDGQKEVGMAFELFQREDTRIDLTKVREFLSTLGSRRLQRHEIDRMLEGLQPDADNCVSLKSFSDLECWNVPPPPRPAQAADGSSSSMHDGPS